MRRRTHVPCVVDVPRPSAAPTRMVQYRPLVGEDAPLDAATALAMRLPARGPGGQAWPTALRLAPLAGELVGCWQHPSTGGS